VSTLPVSAEAVAERIQAMRITAEQSLARVQASVESKGDALARVVAAYRAVVADTGSRLIRAQVQATIALSEKPGDPSLTALLKRTIELLTAWTAHAKGYSAYERPASEAEKPRAIQVGVAPAVIIVIAVAGAVVAVSVTGVAWAVVHYKEAQVLSDEVALIERDPALADAIARVNASAPSSSPADDAAKSGGTGLLWLLAALGLAGAAVYFGPKLGKG
jgi:hypothetical protein